MKKTKTELLNSLKAILGDNTSDEALALCEDVSDSMPDDKEDWKAKYDQLDKDWREKYRQRFFETPASVDKGDKGDKDTDDDDVDDKDKPMSFDNLFKPEEKK